MTADLDAVRAMLGGLRRADEYEPLGHAGWDAADMLEALAADLAATRAALTEAQGEVERLKSSLTGIRWAADYRRKERKSTGEDHEYYYHTADAALKGTTP